MTDRQAHETIGQFCCLLSQCTTFDAVRALVALLSTTMNAAYSDGYEDGKKFVTTDKE